MTLYGCLFCKKKILYCFKKNNAAISAAMHLCLISITEIKLKRVNLLLIGLWNLLTAGLCKSLTEVWLGNLIY